MRLPLLLGLVASLAFAADKEKPRLAVLIVIDQLGATTFDNRVPLVSGGIKRLLAEGLHVDHLRYETAPTVTSEGHATLVTGCWPQTHGITSNEWFDEGLQKQVYSTEDPKFQTLGREPRPRDCTAPTMLRAPTLGDTLKAWKPGAKVIAVSGKERSAILPGGMAPDAVVWIDMEKGFFTTSTYYAKELPAFVTDANALIGKTVLQGLAPAFPGGGFTGKSPLPKNHLGADGGVEGPLNERFEWQPLFEHAEVDAALSAVKAYSLGKDDVPDFLAISFSGHDFFAHAFGPDSAESEDDFRRIDFQIGRLLDGLDKEVGKGKYVVALTADHGGAQNPDVLKQRGVEAGKLDGRGTIKNVFEAEADAALGPGDWFTGWWTPGLYCNAAARKKIHEADARLIVAGRKLEGVAEVIPLPEVSKPGTFGALGDLYRHGLYPGRSPDFIIVPKPFWLYGIKETAAHGTPWLYDRYVPLVLFGGGIKKGELEAADAVDLAPTLAFLLGAPAPAASVGKVIPTK
jgi:predicted AlkP superfamily pyrophosphatase or phosphodiesterase